MNCMSFLYNEESSLFLSTTPSSFQHHLITQFTSLGCPESFPEFHDVGTNLQQHLAAGVKLRHYLGARKLPQEDRDLKNAWDHLEQDARERCKIYVRVNQV